MSPTPYVPLPLRLGLVSGLPFESNLVGIPSFPPRRTFLEPFSARQPQPAEVADVEPAGDGGAGIQSLTLREVCAMLPAEWESVTEATISKCWIKSDIVLPEATATLRSCDGD